MSLFVSEIVTPPAHLPVTVDDAQAALAAAVVDEIERTILWRAIVSQERRILIDGPLPSRIEIEPVTAIVSLTQWNPARFPQRKARGRGGVGAEDTAVVVDAESYSFVSRDPAGTIIAPLNGDSWPAPLRPFGSFALTYMAGWTVTPESSPGAGDGVNKVPASVRLMVERAVAFRAGSGLGDLSIGSLKINVANSYKTDKIPPEIASIGGRAWAYRPGIIAARP